MPVRIKDASGRSGAVAVEVVASEASELLMSLCAVHGGDAPDSFDIGAERMAQLRASETPELSADIADLMGTIGDIPGELDKVPAHLLGLAYVCPSPRAAADLISFIAAMDAREVQLTVLGRYMGTHTAAPPEIIARAVDGDDAGIQSLLESCEEEFVWREVIKRTLDRGPQATKELLLRVLEGWNEQILQPARAEFWPLLERDAETKREQVKTMPIERVIETTTGVRFSRDPSVRKIVLMPTFFLRPWILLTDYKDIAFFCYAAADEGAEVASADPPTSLVRLYKALGDESRLKVLKTLTQGDLSLREAADLLGVAKSTAHHHLALLRQAGLVWVQEVEGDKVYSLRDDLIPQAAALLQGYLGR